MQGLGRGQPIGPGVTALRVRWDLRWGGKQGVGPGQVPPSPAGGDSGTGRGGRLGGALNCLNGL